MVDGHLDDSIWKTVPAVGIFFNKWPTDKGQAALQTWAQVTYTDQYLYVGFKMAFKGKYTILSLKRDGNIWYSDGVSIVLDPMNQRSQALFFGVNAGGAQFDGIVDPTSGATTDWDTKWYTATQTTDTSWTAEMAIPFSSLRFSEQQRVWGVNFIRSDMVNNVFSTWTNVPVQMNATNLGFLGTLRFEDPLPKANGNKVFIPYTSSSLTKKFTPYTPYNWKANAGFDAKIAVNNALNLDLTVNPDFSQVEVDKQITNLERFDIYLPERRNFFLENSDLFTNFGTSEIRPFFSRRIGLSSDGLPVKIYAGARLTGNLHKNLRIGLLNITTEKTAAAPMQNYTAAAFEQRLFGRTNIKGLITNRNSIGNLDKEAYPNAVNYNRLGALEFNYTSINGKYRAGAKFHTSHTPGISDSNHYWNLNAEYVTRKWWLTTGFNRVGKNYLADVGFTPRLYNDDAVASTKVRMGYINSFSRIEHRIYPVNRKKINTHIFSYQPILYLNDKGKAVDTRNYFRYSLAFANRNEIQVAWQTYKIQLPFTTQIIAQADKLSAGLYKFSNAQLTFYSDIRKRFNYFAVVESGTYYNGRRFTVNGNIMYRTQPWGSFGIDASYNNIHLNGKKIHLWLLSPKVEVAFTNTLFWTTFLQYNTQANNMNVNTRLQWRFKPMSDLYLVYTDNYIADHLQIKNRALVAKLSYWLNW
jgi:hypothetical protein